MKIPCQRPTCKKSFEPAQNKRYCSGHCRVLHHYERTDALSRQMWQELPLLPTNPELNTLSEPERLRTLITSKAPPQAAGYRLGCPNRFTSEQLQYLRWFPSVNRELQGYFPLNPFMRPMVANEGLFVVAYFAADLRMLGQPSFKIQVNWAQQIIKWSHGDRKLLLGRG